MRRPLTAGDAGHHPLDLFPLAGAGLVGAHRLPRVALRGAYACVAAHRAFHSVDQTEGGGDDRTRDRGDIGHERWM
jgi:hypothetical protein